MALRREGHRCIMVGPDSCYTRTEDNVIFDDWLPVLEWSSSKVDAFNTIKIAQAYQISWLVLDDYRVDEAYQLAIRDSGLRWLQFDGPTRKPLWADVVINANPGARPEDYQAVLRKPNMRLLLGPRYAILRPEFYQIIAREPGRPIKRILLTFGGGDDLGLNQLVLSMLLPITSPDQQFIVISGATNPSNPSLSRWVEIHGQGRVILHIDPQQVASLFASCEVAVMAGGTSTYEAACCGIPMILIAIADNQISQSIAWSHCGCAIYIGTTKDATEINLNLAFKEMTSLRVYKKTMGCLASHSLRRNSSSLIAEVFSDLSPCS